MLLTSRETAYRLEEADTLHTIRQIDVCAQLFPDHKSVTVPIGDGVAAITLPLFGRKLNRVDGYGMPGRILDEDLAMVEDLFTKNGVDTEICLCPLADASGLQVLASRGYSVKRFSHSYACVLTDEYLKEAKAEGVVIFRLPAERAHEFPSVSLAGFGDGGRDRLLLETLGRSAALRTDTSLYFASVDGKVAGSAAMAFIETTKGGVAHLYLDSTLPEYRGRGIQSALLRARLTDARKAGFDLASVRAQPGNGASCRNIERSGFSLAYTKAWFAKARK